MLISFLYLYDRVTSTSSFSTDCAYAFFGLRLLVRLATSKNSDTVNKQNDKKTTMSLISWYLLILSVAHSV